MSYILAPEGCNARGESFYYADRVKDPKWYLRSGWLTLYAMACGYREEIELDSGNRITLELDGIFHVRYCIDGNYTWECFDTVTDARKAFCQVVDMIKANRLAVA